MKTAAAIIATLITAATLTLTQDAHGQYAIRGTYQGYNGVPVIQRHASTYAEGLLRGRADLVRGIGEYNYNTSLAMINRQHALSLHYDNQIKKVNTYFEKRQLNQQYRAAERGPRKTPEDMARYLAKPPVMQLTAQEMDRVTKKINWPASLRADQFQSDREAIEALYVARTPANSGPGSTNEAEIQQLVKQMRQQVRMQARQMGANQSIVAKRFLDGLSLEASRFEASQGLASLR